MLTHGPAKTNPLDLMGSPTVTRFAPSPTGYLHIGSARTALFCWAFARHTSGKFLLRVEDTDRERSTEAAVQAIFDGLRWLGLDWDGEPVMQFSRAARHAEIARELLARGRAYYCYCSPEELAQMREEARAAGRPPRYDGRWRDRDPSEAPAGVAPVIRIKAPHTGEIVVDDHVQGKVVFRAENLDDFIILRSDGTPLTCWRSSSTITTWASPTSSAATTTSPMPRARSAFIAAWAGTCPRWPISR